MTNRHFLTSSRLFWLIPVLIVGIGGISLAFSLSGSPEESEADSNSALPVSVVKVQPVDHFFLQRSYTGLVAARRSSELSFERSGAEIETIQVDEGARVKKGQVLALLDKRYLLAKKKELSAQLKVAEAVLKELVAGPREEVIAAAKAQVRDLLAQEDFYQKAYRRVSLLGSSRAASQQELDQAINDLKSTKAKLDAAKEKLRELQNGTRKEKLDAQKATVERLQSSIELVDVELKDTELTAPFEGSISKRYLDEGAIVSPKTPVFRIVEDQHLESRIGIPVASANRLEKDQELSVKVGGITYPGKVKAILPELNKVTRTRMVVLNLQGAAGKVVPGEVAKLSLKERINQKGYWLSSTALARSTRGLWSAFAVNQKNRVERREVEVLYTEGDRLLVRGTLFPGDQIITRGTHRIVPGQKVRVITKANSTN